MYTDQKCSFFDPKSQWGRKKMNGTELLPEIPDSPEYIENLKKFDDEAWTVLKTHYAGRLKTFILGSLIEADLSRISVQDVEQDVWMIAIRKINEFQWQAKGLLYLWLRTIAHNIVRNHIKTYHHIDPLSQSNSATHEFPLIDPPSDPEEESFSEHQLAAEEVQLRAELANIGINPKHIDIYILYQIYKLKPREIAKKLATSSSVIRTTIYRVEIALTKHRNGSK